MAKTDDRLFAPFPIEMDEHPKIAPLSDAAFRALFEATFYSRRMLSDGFLDERIVLKRWGQAVADELSSNDHNRPSWIRVEGGWQIHDFEKHHPLRAEIEAKRSGLSAKRSVAGKLGNESRWGGKSNAKSSQTDRKAIANDRSETETETLKTSAPSVLASEFDTAWNYWPKKVERKQAFDRFKIAAKKRGVEALVNDIIIFGGAYSSTTEKKFVPALGVWLGRERWTDELPGTGSPKRGNADWALRV